MMENRRKSDIPLGDPARVLAILYTLGYFAIVFMMMLRPLPEGNESSLNQLIGALTIIQTGIIAFYFRGSKTDETAQTKIMEGKDKADAALVQIAMAAPAPATNGAPVVTPAPATKNGIIPAKEVVKPPIEETKP